MARLGLRTGALTVVLSLGIKPVLPLTLYRAVLTHGTVCGSSAFPYAIASEFRYDGGGTATGAGRLSVEGTSLPAEEAL
jgi:hypothetical protein